MWVTGQWFPFISLHFNIPKNEYQKNRYKDKTAAPKPGFGPIDNWI